MFRVSYNLCALKSAMVPMLRGWQLIWVITKPPSWFVTVLWNKANPRLYSLWKPKFSYYKWLFRTWTVISKPLTLSLAIPSLPSIFLQANYSNLSGCYMVYGVFVNCSTCTIRYDFLINTTLFWLSGMAEIYKTTTHVCSWADGAWKVLRMSEELSVVPTPSSFPLKVKSWNSCVALWFLYNVMIFETGTEPTS